MSAGEHGATYQLERTGSTAGGDQIVGRQAIVGPDDRIVGYGLLGRPGPAAGFESLTALDLLAGAPDGVERLVGGGLAVLPIAADLVDELPAARPGSRIVVQVADQGGQIPDLVSAYRGLAGRGHRTAVSALSAAADSSGELAELADVLVVPTGSFAREELPQVVATHRRPGLEFLATGVDDSSTATAAAAAGFDYRQGTVVPVPPQTSERTLDASRFGPMRLAASLLGGAFEVAELEDILRIEPVMTYQLLRLAGAGADNGMRRQVRSIREALVLIGSVRLQSWLALLMLRNAGEDHLGAISLAITRARMCEVLTRTESAKLAPTAFTAGILSSFDLLLGVNLDMIASELPLEDGLREAAFGTGNRVAEIRHDVTAYQRGLISEPRMSGLTDDRFDVASIAAIRWAEAATWTFSASPTAG